MNNESRSFASQLTNWRDWFKAVFIFGLGCVGVLALAYVTAILKAKGIIT